MKNEEEKEAAEKTEAILGQIEPKKENLIPLLQRIQAELGYIPLTGMNMVADYLEIPLGEVYGVATFYNQFRLTPPGKYQIKVCIGTACHVKRSYIILEEWQRRLEIEEGETSEDRLYSLEKVACVGCCALAPVTVVSADGDDTFHGHMMTSKVNGLVLEFDRKESDEREE